MIKKVWVTDLKGKKMVSAQAVKEFYADATGMATLYEKLIGEMKRSQEATKVFFAREEIIGKIYLVLSTSPTSHFAVRIFSSSERAKLEVEACGFRVNEKLPLFYRCGTSTWVKNNNGEYDIIGLYNATGKAKGGNPTICFTRSGTIVPYRMADMQSAFTRMFKKYNTRGTNDGSPSSSENGESKTNLRRFGGTILFR